MMVPITRRKTRRARGCRRSRKRKMFPPEEKLNRLPHFPVASCGTEVGNGGRSGRAPGFSGAHFSDSARIARPLRLSHRLDQAFRTVSTTLVMDHATRYLPAYAYHFLLYQ